MFAITGVTGKVGGQVAKALLGAGREVRAVVREEKKGAAWRGKGCKVAVAEMGDVGMLTAAFREAEAVFVLAPPVFDPSAGFSEARALAASLKTALRAARPKRVVYLSTIGADTVHTNLLSQHTILEEELGALEMPITFLRPAWFMENCAWDVGPARERGVIPSFLQPLDHAIPMVATADIGRVAAALLQEEWVGKRVVELEGPRRVSAADVAAAFSKVLGKAVRAEAVAWETWEGLFVSQGMRNPWPRVRMIEGFNAGWIDFAERGRDARKGVVELETVVRELVAGA